MLIHLNGWPGVGKLTIARALHARLGGHLLDNHTVYNPAFSLTRFRSPEFYETVRAVREVAFARIAALSPEIPVIMTNGLNTGAWGRENWEAILQLAPRRGSRLYAVTVTCDPAEHAKRMVTQERSYLGKLTDPDAWKPFSKDLQEEGADHLLRLDTTGIPAGESAERICDWLAGINGELPSARL